MLVYCSEEKQLTRLTSSKFRNIEESLAKKRILIQRSADPLDSLMKKCHLHVDTEQEEDVILKQLVTFIQNLNQ